MSDLWLVIFSHLPFTPFCQWQALTETLTTLRVLLPAICG